MFDSLNADAIRQVALHTNGAAGPSELDAHAWKHFAPPSRNASHNLRSSLASVGQCIANTYVNPDGLSAFVACCLIPLDKCLGVRPIGVGEAQR